MNQARQVAPFVCIDLRYMSPSYSKMASLGVFPSSDQPPRNPGASKPAMPFMGNMGNPSGCVCVCVVFVRKWNPPFGG